MFSGINGMSYHWWSPSALLCKPCKQIYGIYKYMFFKDFEPTNYIIIFNYPIITLEFMIWCFLVLIKPSSGMYCHCMYSQLAIAVESKEAISLTAIEKAKEKIPASQRDYSTEPGAAPSFLTLQERQHTDSIPLPLQHTKNSRDLKSEQNLPLIRWPFISLLLSK